jgi:hypothetical protein
MTSITTSSLAVSLLISDRSSPEQVSLLLSDQDHAGERPQSFSYHPSATMTNLAAAFGTERRWSVVLQNATLGMRQPSATGTVKLDATIQRLQNDRSFAARLCDGRALLYPDPLA